MSKLNFLITLFSVLCFSLNYIYAQDRIISIEDMFVLADENNKHLKVQKTSVNEAISEIKVAKNAQLPSINMSLSFSFNGDGTVFERDFSDSFTAEIPDFGNNFGLEISQLIFSGGAVKNSVKLSELKSKAVQYNAETNRQNIHFAIAENYLNLCKIHNQLQVFASNIELTNKTIVNMKNRYTAGVDLKNDIIRYELQLQNLNYCRIELENTKTILNNSLTSALGISEDTNIIPDISNIKNFSDKDIGYWHTTAMSSSTVVNLAKNNVTINEYTEKLSHSEKFPKIFLFAADYLDGPITIEIPAIDKNFNYWAAGVGIKYDLSNLLYKTDKNIKTGRFALQKSAEQQSAAEEDIKLAIQSAYIRYKESFELLETKKKSVELAQKNYETISHRYENGLVLITDLLDAASQKLDAELQEVNADMNTVLNYYRLKHISGTL